MAKGHTIFDLISKPDKLVKSLNPAQLFSKEGWTGRRNIYSQLIDPLGFALKGPQPEKPKVPLPVNEAGAEARDMERRRLAVGAGSRANQIGGGLGGNLGKSTLGGGY